MDAIRDADPSNSHPRTAIVFDRVTGLHREGFPAGDNHRVEFLKEVDRRHSGLFPSTLD